MTTRLSDHELASRIRAGNRKRAARQYVRRRESGNAAVSVWISASVKAALDNAAREQAETLSGAVERLLALGLRQEANERQRSKSGAE